MPKPRPKKSLPKKKPKPAAKRPTKPAKPAKKSNPKSAPTIPAKSALLAEIPKVDFLQFAASARAILLARAGKETKVTLFDLESQTETPPLQALPKCSAIALSPDNRHLAVGTSSGILAVQSTQTGKILWKAKAGGEPVRQIAFTLDGSVLLAAAEPAEEGDAWLRVHKTATGEIDASFEPVPGARCCNLALSPDGVFLAVSEIRSNSVLIWHLPTRQMGACLRLPPERGRITDIAFGINARHLFIAQKHQLSTWNAETGVRDLAIDASQFASVAALPATGAIAVLRLEEAAAFLEIRGDQTLHLRREIRIPGATAGQLAASADGSLLALCGAAKNAWLWKAEKF